MERNPCIRIGHLKIVDHLVLGIADLQLKNKKLNLTHSSLETINMNSWNQVCDDLTDGSITGAFITAPMAMDLFAAGLDIKILMFTHRSGSVIIKNDALNINNVSDFKGKTVLVPAERSIQTMLLHRLLSSAGLNLGAHDDINADVTYEIVSPFLMTEMLMNDNDEDIAGIAVEDPIGTEAVHKGVAKEVCTSGSLWKDHPCCVFVLSTSFLEKYPEAVGELVSLFAQTGQLLEESKGDELLLMVQEFLGQKKEVIRHVLLETDICFDPSLWVPDIEALNLIQDYLCDSMGILKNKIDINNLVDNSFIINA
ncbi:MAG: ABC transporter substrate-binding protein [Desulfobacteraceae bacterium]|nr:ABC transporter substrate-binding protein [Desulfobacteraceae bacterium]